MKDEIKAFELERPLAINLAEEIFGELWSGFDDKKQAAVINLIYDFAIKHQCAMEKEYAEKLEKIKLIAEEAIKNGTNTSNPCEGK